jgi:hypothetical protein
MDEEAACIHILLFQEICEHFPMTAGFLVRGEAFTRIPAVAKWFQFVDVLNVEIIIKLDHSETAAIHLSAVVNAHVLHSD